MDPLSSEEWNALALSHGVLEDGQSLREPQMDTANVVIGRKKDIVVVSPTGSGKSLSWVLPLLAQKHGISLVIIPYTSLGFQGEQRHANTQVRCTFLHSGSLDKSVLENIARGGEMHVVYTCVEMLETPAIAQILYSESFQAQLSGTYIDEAHSVHESLSWRPGYARLYLLRRVIGTDAPLVGLSATLPKTYRDTLEIYAGLRPDYHLINLGNFRPELSTIVMHMQHSATSFMDLGFAIPLDATAETLQQTLIYSDDLELLTSMYWWGYNRLGSMHLPVHLIDILHAGLSDEHQQICTEDFIAGKTKILLGSDKIGAGMDFPHVRLVIQYRCRGLTLVRWEQRRGRGGRRPGMTATGVILVEKSMTGEEKQSPTVDAPKSEDPGIVELARSPGRSTCQKAIVDRRLENPSRGNSNPCTRCSNCNPQLRVATQYTFIMEEINPHKAASRGAISDVQKKRILDDLLAWRLKLWKEEWEAKWPSYGPESLVSDHGLREITQRAQTISTIDDLDSIAQIPHLDELAPSLLTALRSILERVCGIVPTTPLNHTNASIEATSTPSYGVHPVQWAVPDMQATPTMIPINVRPKQGKLAEGEFVVSFSS